jgi:serine/threonine protein kinase
MSPNEKEGKCSLCGFEEKNFQPSPHHLPLRTILNGKYLIGRVLGEGGFGITYIGWDLNLDLKIAIKEYYPTGFVTRENALTYMVTPFTGEKTEFFQSGREKFVDEAKRLAKFYSLPGIVSIKDFFLENGTAYIVMEYVEGETLKQYLSRMGGKIPADKVFELMKPVMNSLTNIHKAGIIHRDISPDNIMITNEGNIKLIDFGAARDFENSGNRSLSVMLKPGYAPEEQYRSRGVQGPWTDIYALCATIYKAITGITPDEASERLRRDQLKSPSQFNLHIMPHQETALMKGLAVLQEERFDNIVDLMKNIYEVQNQGLYETKSSNEETIKNGSQGILKQTNGTTNKMKNERVFIDEESVKNKPLCTPRHINGTDNKMKHERVFSDEERIKNKPQYIAKQTNDVNKDRNERIFTDEERIRNRSQGLSKINHHYL